MGLLGGSEEKSPESPEEIVEEEERTVVEDMESLQQEIEEAIKAETNLFNAIKNGESETTIDGKTADIEIYLQSDIEPEDKDIRAELQKLKDHESQLQASKPLMEKHQRLLELIQGAINEAEEEIQRLEEVVEISKKALRGQDFSHDEMMESVRDKITRDTQEAEVIEEQLEKAEQIEGKIRQAQQN
jgi:DNA repair exonuclease SbcCD ATPase subunit